MTGEPEYVKAFGHVPNEMLLKLAEARRRVPSELRGMLLAVLAAPEDKAALMALHDWLANEVSFPEAVELGGFRYPLEEPRPAAWWQDKGRSRLALETGWAILEHFDRLGRGVWSHGVSIADVARLSWDELTDIPGIKKARGLEVRTWLANMGLYLRGETPSMLGHGPEVPA